MNSPRKIVHYIFIFLIIAMSIIFVLQVVFKPTKYYMVRQFVYFNVDVNMYSNVTLLRNGKGTIYVEINPSYEAQKSHQGNIPFKGFYIQIRWERAKGDLVYLLKDKDIIARVYNKKAESYIEFDNLKKTMRINCCGILPNKYKLSRIDMH